MAKQDSVVKIRGTVDNLTFLRTKNGHEVRKKIKQVDKQTLATDPRYARLRENMSEFNRAVEAGKLMRLAVQNVLLNCSDKRLSSRLTSYMMKVVTSDTVGKRGQRTVTNGNAELLNGFNFNIGSELSLSLKVAFTSAIDRASGKLTVDIPSFIPENVLTPAKGATHFTIHSAGVEINFGTSVFDTKMFETAGIPISNDASPAIPIIHGMNAASTNPLFILLGIRFFQEVNGILYPLKNNAANALTIVAANNPV